MQILVGKTGPQVCQFAFVQGHVCHFFKENSAKQKN